MKSLRRFFMAAVASIFMMASFSACEHSEPFQMVTGQWQLQGNEVKVEFRKNGHYHLTTNKGTKKGKWSIVNEGEQPVLYLTEGKKQRQMPIREVTEERLVLENEPYPLVFVAM